MKLTRIVSALSATCLLLGCSAEPTATSEPADVTTMTGADTAVAAPDTSSTAPGAGATVPAAPSTTLAPIEVVQLPGTGSPGVDLALGEWALVPSATEAPPGTITFRFRNQGTVTHALRIRSAGSGKNRLEWRADEVSPGEIALLIADLPPGTYEIDCPVEDGHGEHDALGMEMVFTVREGAPALAALPSGAEPTARDETAGAPTVAIAQFSFEPVELSVSTGATVTWNNTDPAPHTVTSDSFDTGMIDQGASGTVTFSEPGTFDYFCAIHPAMQGRVVVDP